MARIEGYNEESTMERLPGPPGISFVIVRNGDGIGLVSREFESNYGPIGEPKQDPFNLPPLFISCSLFHESSSLPMPPNLQGLNIVHPQIHTDSHDLLAGQQYSDLSAQLDLWTNLTFDSEEPMSSTRSNEEKCPRKSVSEEDEEEARSPVTTEKAVHDGHINVVTGTNIGTNEASRISHPVSALPAFDINSFLAGFGIDPFASPSPQQPIAPSLAQLLAFHSAAAASQHSPTFAIPSSGPSTASASTTSFRPTPNAPSETDSEPSSPTHEEPQPASKRARTRKASISAAASPEPEFPSSNLSAAEDKRRRNTAASARFRLKKKEREAALEGKAKELEHKVSELERECEGLRRENGWLKGLVVGVTGVAQGPIPPPLISPPQNHSTSSGSKRRRDDGDTA